MSGGQNNRASGTLAAVSGGQSNTASGTLAAVSGGQVNRAAGNWGTILGGFGNVITSGGAGCQTIPTINILGIGLC